MTAKRYTVKNGNDPTPGHITEEKESELEEFIDYAFIVMGVLGHRVFIPVNSSVSTDAVNKDSISDEPLFSLKTNKVNARGRRTSEGFVVLSNSELSPIPTKSCPDTIKHLRVKYSERINADNILVEDTLFSSPSAAAGFVAFASANGLTMWINSEGRSLRDLENQEA